MSELIDLFLRACATRVSIGSLPFEEGKTISVEVLAALVGEVKARRSIAAVLGDKKIKILAVETSDENKIAIYLLDEGNEKDEPSISYSLVTVEPLSFLSVAWLHHVPDLIFHERTFRKYQ